MNWKIYMDVCCLNRPFDDQSQARVHLEAEAVLAILNEIEQGHWTLLAGEVVDLEMDQTPDIARRERVRRVMPIRRQPLRINDAALARAAELEARGFGGTDALHLAAAEQAGADIFLSTDDQLLRL
ncbi:MAG: type II toxin-antitoxin system VapC family toxin, partial [Verrucomicrobia bacterium]|nr:type II toxin-antitoxin system VapC family toxin [Verrucomicrobiota bacterium]